MIGFFANIFGYLLNFLYNLVSNYGLSIILFSIIIKLAMLPLSIKQQKAMKKNSKIQEEMKQIQFKYKNDPERLNQETIELYKREKMSPFSGCFTAIIQIVLLFSIFYLVRAPLTYMKKIDSEIINKYQTQINEEGLSTNSAYPEIEIIREIDKLKQLEKNENKEEIETLNINMNLFGLDLSKVPTQNLDDFKVYIIPVLYVISSFISMRISTSMQSNNKKKENGEEENELANSMEQANKSMSLLMPIMSISIAIIAPLGLALYWLLNNILMIIERVVLNKILKDEEVEENV